MILLLLAFLVTPAGASRQSKPAEPFELDSFRWQTQTTPQTAIIATNEWGDLRVRTSARPGLSVSALIQKIGTTARQFDVRVDEQADRVLVTVRPLVARPRGRVDLTLMVPPGKQLEGTTRDGLAEIKYNGEVRARTRAGIIAIETPSSATARSDTGSIMAKLTGDAWQPPLSFESGSGDITVWLPEQSSAVVRADTRGKIDVGLPHTVSSVARKSRVEARIGKGGVQLTIESVTGNVRVLPYAARQGL